MFQLRSRALGHQLSTLLDRRWSRWLGETSFAFYLVHLLVIQVIASFWPQARPSLSLLPALGLTVATLLVALLLAAALHKWVEKPGQRLLATGPSRPVASEPASGV